MKKKGFTLIELIVIVAIISILATVAITQYMQYNKKVYNAAALSDLRNIQTTVEAYRASHNRYP